MLFRRKKPTSDPAPSVPMPERGPIGAEAKTQFLTGDGRVDRRTIEVLLAAIARVSQSQDIEHLLAYIVDTSIEVTGAERGILLLAGKSGELEPRMARQKGGKPAEGDLRPTSVVACSPTSSRSGPQ
jgi:hypothetical protein